MRLFCKFWARLCAVSETEEKTPSRPLEQKDLPQNRIARDSAAFRGVRERGRTRADRGATTPSRNLRSSATSAAKNLHSVTERKFVQFVDLKILCALAGKLAWKGFRGSGKNVAFAGNSVSFRVFRGQKFPCLGLRNRGVNAAQPFIHQGLPRQMNISLISERGNGVLSLIKSGLGGEIGGETCCGRIFEEATSKRSVEPCRLSTNKLFFNIRFKIFASCRLGGEIFCGRFQRQAGTLALLCVPVKEIPENPRNPC